MGDEKRPINATPLPWQTDGHELKCGGQTVALFKHAEDAAFVERYILEHVEMRSILRRLSEGEKLDMRDQARLKYFGSKGRLIRR